MNEPLETAELLAFAKTVESKSLSRAAAELSVPRATISRRLQRLEERLGVRLLRRTTRSLALTDAGSALYQHARVVLDAVEQAEGSVRRGDQVIRGSLRVSVPPMWSAGFNGLICDFAKAHPAVELHVHFSSQYVDLLRGGYDVALRASTKLEPGLIARTLMRDQLILVASPAYLAELGTPKTRRDLRQHRCLMGFARGELPETHWPLIGGGKLRVEGCLFSNELVLLADAARRGRGIALLPRIFLAEALESGALVHVLPGIIGATSQVALVYPEREFVPPQVRAFVDAVAAWAPTGMTPSANDCSPRRARTKRQAR